jgi:DNA-binding PadR family transcriptional regulator
MKNSKLNISDKSIEMLEFMNPYGATITELIDRFSVPFDARIYELLHLGLIIEYPHKENEPVGCYILTHKGQAYLEDLKNNSDKTKFKITIEFIKWIVPTIISIFALIIAMCKK